MFNELEEKAKTANNGVWVFEKGTVGVYTDSGPAPICDPETHKEGEYIASADPETILSMISEIRRCHKVLKVIASGDDSTATDIATEALLGIDGANNQKEEK